MNKYINADKLKKLIDEKWKELADKNVKVGGGEWDAEISTYLSVLRLIDILQQEQPEVDYNKFEKLFDDFCERNKGHHITTHDACMWFWGLGLNARKEE